MCGIFGVHGLEGETASYRPRALALARRLRHRGPDWSGCVVAQDAILCHERLAIVGVGELCYPILKEGFPNMIVDTGAQPLTSEDGKLILCVNGEIYNHRILRKNLKQPAKFKTHSDCEVILHLVSSPTKFLSCGSPTYHTI